MDGPNIDLCDSDSGESWTLLEDNPSYANEAPEFSDNFPKQKGSSPENVDNKDDDTDGISVITDSEPESIPCDINYDTPLPEEENRPAENKHPQYISVDPFPDNSAHGHSGSIRNDDDLLSDNGIKLKTYVHKRNKRLSTVLNIIVLGSVITAAGVAIGHMWGVKDDCSLHTTPSVNKILSNLYKLQEENAFLRSKLKELTLLNNINLQRKSPSEKLPTKHPRCKKIFEESLNNRNVNKITKCIDYENGDIDQLAERPLVQTDEKEFLRDIDKLKQIYVQNKSWLDESISKRLKNEVQLTKELKDVMNQAKENNQKRTNQSSGLTSKLSVDIETGPNKHTLDNNVDELANENIPEKKISYADSLRIIKDDEKIKRSSKRDKVEVNENKEKSRKKRSIRSHERLVEENSLSDEDVKKDNRYIAPRHKQERKKKDRQHLQKKQKRKNKYEHWEMKTGYLKDFDEFSVTSSQENDFTLKRPEKNILAPDFDSTVYVHEFSDTNDNAKSTQTLKRTKALGKHMEKDTNWYDKRAALRMEARKKLEKELFEETSPNKSNNAGWYFKRMQKREQCRVKGDNSTHRKHSKRSMNFKSKH